MCKKIILLIGSTLLCVGCTSTCINSTNMNNDNVENRYVVTEQQKLKGYRHTTTDEIINITDTKTGDEYLLYKGSYKGSLVKIKEGNRK